MKSIIVSVFSLLVFCHISIGQSKVVASDSIKSNQKFSKESVFTNIPPGTAFGNSRHLCLDKIVFKKAGSDVKGVSDDASVSMARAYAIAISKLGKDNSGRNRYKVQVNVDGEMNFEPSNKVFEFQPNSKIFECSVNSKMVSFGSFVMFRGENNKSYFSVVPVFWTPLNVADKNVFIMASSIDGNMEYNPGKDQILIYKPRDLQKGCKSVDVTEVEIDVPFNYGSKGEDKWCVLKWDETKRTIRSEVYKFDKIGFITANHDWSITLCPGDTRFKGKAGEKVKVPVGNYGADYMSFKIGNCRLSEFDYTFFDGKRPDISIKQNETLVIEPLKEVIIKNRYGWHNDELTIVFNLENARNARNMSIEYDDEQLEFEYEIVEEKSGEVIAEGNMHYG